MKAASRIRRLRADVSNIIEAMLSEQSDPSISWHPKADLVEFEDRFEIRMELPGLAAEHISIEVQDRTVKVHGEKSRSTIEPTAHRYHMMERFVGPFEVSVEVPRSVLPHASSARLDNGVLTISLHMVADQRHRSYSIEVEEESITP